jgi:hypothetical protein
MNNKINDRFNVYNNSSPHQNLPGSSMKKHVFPLQCQPSAICHTQQKEPTKTRKTCFRRLVLGWGEEGPKNTHKTK